MLVIEMLFSTIDGLLLLFEVVLRLLNLIICLRNCGLLLITECNMMVRLFIGVFIANNYVGRFRRQICECDLRIARGFQILLIIFLTVLLHFPVKLT